MDTETSSVRLDDSDERAIRALVSRAQDSQNHTGSLMTLHTPDTVIVNLAGRRVFERAAFSEAMTAALSSPLKQVSTELEIVDIRLATPDVAIVSCVKTVHDDRDDSESATALPAAGALTYVLSRTDGTWKIAVAQTTPMAEATRR